MGKQSLPFMQFFPSDYLADTRVLTLETRGAWADILCQMHLAENRGYLSMPVDRYARMIGATVPQTAVVLGELMTYGVASGEVNGAPWGECNAPVTLSAQDRVTLVCRRMAREEEARAQGRFRVQKHRERARGVTPEKRECNTARPPPCNGDVTRPRQGCVTLTRAELPDARCQMPDAIHTLSVVSLSPVTAAPPQDQMPDARCQMPEGECERERVCESAPLTAGDAVPQSDPTTAQGRGMSLPAAPYSETEQALFQACRESWGYVFKDWEDPEKLQAGISTWPGWRTFLAEKKVSPDKIRLAIRWYKKAGKLFPPTLSDIRDWFTRHAAR